MSCDGHTLFFDNALMLSMLSNWESKLYVFTNQLLTKADLRTPLDAATYFLLYTDVSEC